MLVYYYSWRLCPLESTRGMWDSGGVEDWKSGRELDEPGSLDDMDDAWMMWMRVGRGGGFEEEEENVF